MTRFSRKNRTDIEFKGCGGITDAFDDMIKELWRINDDEYDYLIDDATDEELDFIIPQFKNISEMKKAIEFVNNKLSNYKK